MNYVEALFNLTLTVLCVVVIQRWIQTRRVHEHNQRLKDALDDLTRENARLREERR